MQSSWLDHYCNYLKLWKFDCVCSVEFDFINLAAKLVRLSAAAQTRPTLSHLVAAVGLIVHCVRTRPTDGCLQL